MKTLYHSHYGKITILLLLLVSMLSIKLHRINREVNRLYHFEVTVRGIDSETKVPLSLAYSFSDAPERLIRDNVGYRSGSPEKGMTMSGYSTGQNIITVSSNGYHPKEVKIDDETEWLVIVELELKKETEQGAAGNPLPAE